MNVDEFPISGDNSPIGFFKISKNQDQDKESSKGKLIEDNFAAAQAIVNHPIFVNAVRTLVNRVIEEDEIRNFYLDRVLIKLDNIAESLRIRTQCGFETLDRNRIRSRFKEKA